MLLGETLAKPDELLEPDELFLLTTTATATTTMAMIAPVLIGFLPFGWG